MSGWYDEGGVLPSGLETVRNDTDHPIPVTTEDHIHFGLDYVRDRYGNDGA